MKPCGYPIAEIQRQRGRQALFETVVNYTHFHVYRNIQDLTGIRIENGYASEQTYYPLTTQCHVNHLTGEMLLALDYTREFSTAQVESLAGYLLLRILTAMAETPDLAHLEFDPLTSAEKHELLVERNCTRREFNDYAPRFTQERRPSNRWRIRRQWQHNAGPMAV